MNSKQGLGQEVDFERAGYFNLGFLTGFGKSSVRSGLRLGHGAQGIVTVRS